MPDPLSVFDPFLILHILSHLSDLDLCTLYNVAHDWRTFIAQHNCLKAAYFKSGNIEPGIKDHLSLQVPSADEWYDLCRRHFMRERAWDEGHCRVRWAKRVFLTGNHVPVTIGGGDPIDDTLVCDVPPRTDPGLEENLLAFDRRTLRPIASSRLPKNTHHNIYALAGHGLFIIQSRRIGGDLRLPVWGANVFGKLPGTKRLRPIEPFESLSPVSPDCEPGDIIPGFHYLGRFHSSWFWDEAWGLHIDCDSRGNVALLAFTTTFDFVEEVMKLVVFHLADSRPPSNRPDLSTVLAYTRPTDDRIAPRLCSPCANDDFFFIGIKTFSTFSRVSGECLMSFSDVLVPGFQARLAFDFGDTFNDIATRYKNNSGRFQREKSSADALWPPSKEFHQVMVRTFGHEGAMNIDKIIFVREGRHLVLHSNEGWMLVVVDYEEAIREAVAMCQADDRLQKIADHSIVIRINLGCLHLITSGSRLAIFSEHQIVVIDLAKLPSIPFQQRVPDARLDVIVLAGCTHDTRVRATSAWLHMDSSAIYEFVALRSDLEASFKDGCEDSGLEWDPTWGARDWLNFPMGIRVFSFEPEHWIRRSTATKRDSDGSDEDRLVQRQTGRET